MRIRQVWWDRFRLRLVCVTWLGAWAWSAVALDETLVTSGAECRYQVPTNSSDGTSWTARTFDDASWAVGHSGLGYDTAATYASLFGTTVPNGTIDIYARFAFELPTGKNFESLTLRLKYEDGFIAYLNGVEVARGNAPASPAYNSVASAQRADNLAVVFLDIDITPFLPQLVAGTNVLAVHALNISSSSTDFLILPELAAGLPGVVTNLAINEFMALNDSTCENSLGKYEDWIELYNPFLTNVNLSGWYLTDNVTKLTKWQFPSVSASVITGKGYLLVWADSKSYSVTNNELHASFSLSGDGEYLALVKPDGVSVAWAYAPAFPAQCDDVSYGIGLTGESRYFAEPTPGAANAFAGASNEVTGVKFSPKRGVYTNAMPQVSVTVATAGSEIRYTTDCEAPTAASALYSSPFDLSHTAVFRAAAFKSGFAPSVIDTHTYIAADDALRQSGTQPGYPTNWSTYAADYAMTPAVVATYGMELTNALKALPTLSLVTAVSNLFDATTGIYTHPTSTGLAWERETSVEWVDADNDSRFQVECGLQIQGGAFRGFNYSMKKSFSLQFRSTYGEGRLEEDLFGGGAATSFDDLVLRAGANDAWNKWAVNPYKKQYIVDEFMRRAHLAMGGWSPRGKFAHLYLNGLYWGIYNVTEMVSSESASSYFGGRVDTWDILSQGSGAPLFLPPTALDGTLTAWNAMLNLIPATNALSNEAYQRVQGNHPDGTRNLAYPIYLDVGSYIDYMVAQYWSANSDWPWNNWRAFRDRIDSVSTGFKFAMWDCEAGLGVWGDLTIDRTGETNGIAVIQSRLASNAEYTLRFADRVQKHLFNGGVLTPEVAVPMYRELADRIEPALVAESARWSDQDGNAPRTVDQWRAQRDYVLTTFLPQRGARILQFFRNRGLYPGVDAPAFSQFGGSFSNSVNLTVTAATPVYYTTDGCDPRQYGTGVAVGALYTNGISLTRTTRVKARARTAGGEWSALTEAVFTLAEKPALRVTELMYHPGHPVSVGGESYLEGDDEFIELQNAGSEPIGLAGLRFTQGVSFDFTDGAVQALNQGEYVLVVKNIDAFTNRYPSVPAQRIAGAFVFPAAGLDDGGEKIVIEDALGRPVVSFTYDDKWLIATDGAGHSLVPLAGVPQADDELDYPGNWRASVTIGGSPGQAEPAAPATTLVLNEILAHTDYDVPPYDSNDGIELYNTTGQPVVLGPGWYLSDDSSDLTKWEIPATNSLAAYGWRYFDEIHDFHSPITNGFGLNKSSEQVLLSYLPGTGQDRVVDAVSFKGEENGVPLIRYPDGAAVWLYGVLTPGASNRLADIGVRIDEVMYHPKPTAENPENNENDEYVELVNPTAQPRLLMNVEADEGVWRLSGGIDYVFPDNTVLPAGGRLVVVPFDPVSDAEALSAFCTAYALTNGPLYLFGPYSGHLNNKTDAIRLERPVNPDVVGEEVSWHVVDQVTYYDAAPWPADADGTGRPLARRPGPNSGGDPASWVAGLAATPGQAPAKVSVTAPVQDTGYLTPAVIAVSATVEPAFIVGAVQQVVFAVDGVDAASVSAAPYDSSVTLDAREGVRLITARLTDSEGDFTSAAVPVMAYTNMPGFTAGCDQAINLSVTDRVDLHAVIEEQSGTTNPVQFVWSCPGDRSVVVERPTQSDASARFTQPGRYALMLTLYYGQLVTNRFITVTVAETNTINRVPYKEAFETHELGTTLIGIDGWYGAYSDLARVQTNRFAVGTGGYPLAATHGRGLSFSGDIFNPFEQTSSLTNLCMDMLIGFEPGVGEQPDENPDAQLAFWISENRRLLVWHGQPGSSNRWTELTDVTVSSNAFVRLTVQADYACDPSGSFNFRIWVDREPVTRPAVWFATANTNRNYLSSIDFTGMGQIDDLVVNDYNSMLYRRITASAGPHGCVVPAGELLVPVGDSTNISILADPFYQVNTVLADGQGVGPVLSYTFTNVWDEHAISADFLAKLTGSGVPELWLNRLNPAWTDNFAAHELEDSDGDGVPNGQEYVAGTDATNAKSVFQLAFGLSNGAWVVSFPTVPYSGEAYGLGGLRRYALEQADDLTEGPWLGVGGLTNVVGAGQAVVHTNGFDAPFRFFRGRVWLEP